jgi:hypothetical protein
MSEVMGIVQVGDDAQGVVMVPGVCGYVAGSGCVCVLLVVAVPVNFTFAVFLLFCLWCRISAFFFSALLLFLLLLLFTTVYFPALLHLSSIAISYYCHSTP